jgi:uncharacterized protein (TIGR00369 family)
VVTFEARNPSFESIVREGFARQEFMRLIGAELTAVEPGAVTISTRFHAALGQQAGTAHAGVLASIADSACGFAALTLMEPGNDVVSIEFKLNLLAPATGPTLVARGRVVRPGKSITVCAAEVFSGETLVATMLGTMMRKTP